METSDIPINLLFILFFLFIIFISLGFSLKAFGSDAQKNNTLGFISSFMEQSRAGILILYVIGIVLFFSYIPQSFITSYSTPIIIMFIILTAFVFIRTAASSRYMSPYYEFPKKLVVFISAIALFLNLWITNPGNVFNTVYSTISLVFVFLFSIFAFLFFIFYLVAPKNDSSGFQQSIGILFGIVSSSMFIGWLVWMITNYTSKTGWLPILLSTLLIVVLSVLTMKTYSAQFPYHNREKNAFFNLMSQSIFYIPCLFNNSLDWILNKFSGISGISRTNMSDSAQNAKDNVANTSPIVWLLLGGSVSLLTAYYFLPTFKKAVYLGGYKQFINSPISLFNKSVLGTYDQLKITNPAQPVPLGSVFNPDSSESSAAGTDDLLKYNYRYGINLWVYLDAYGPNTNASYKNYANIFNYGGKPLIQYNGAKNSLRIIVGTGEVNSAEAVNTNDKLKASSKIIFEQSGIPLQKWINLVVNSDGGTIDVFMDGKLLKSVGGVAPYMRMDDLTVGGSGASSETLNNGAIQSGLYGKVCNVIYSHIPFTLSNIYYMRYLVKDSNPPMLDLNTFSMQQ